MQKKVVLIDGNSLAYRAFYALPDTMKNSQGQTTNAVFGFTSMLMKLVEDKPDYMAVAFDRKEPTFRHKEYKEYKATRQKSPPTLIEQMPIIKELIASLNIPVFELAGFEADDILGTLAVKAEKEGYKVEIVSGDLDSLQLVNKNIKVMTTRRGISDTILYDEKAVEERFGLKPEQLIDYKALKGDTSDNIPGVPGIGEKTAVELLQKYKTLDNLLQNADQIEKPKLRETLKNEQEKARLCRMLGKIVTDVPVNANFSKREEPDWNKTIELFEKLDFKSFANKYKKNETLSTEDIVNRKRVDIGKYDYKIVNNLDDLKSLCKRLEKAESFAFDTETDSLNTFTARLIGMSVSITPGEAYYLPFGHKLDTNLRLNAAVSSNQRNRDVQSQVPLQESLDLLRPILEDKSLLKAGHNLKYDCEVLLKYGIKVAPPFFDTMVAAYLLDPISGGYNLKKVGARYLGRHEMIKFDELAQEGKDFSDVPLETAKDYACSDADVTNGLKTELSILLKKEQMWDLFQKIEMPLLDVLINMEETGVYVDASILNKLGVDIEKQTEELERHIFAIAGETFNINSPKQLGVILFQKLQLPVIKKTKTGASTDAEVLEELSGKFEIAEKLLEYRSITKIKSTYIDTLPELINKKTGRIHANFNQTITATGRLSSSNPNMQNIPIKTELGRKIRTAFVPQKKGWQILAADYSQIELRILAHLSQDKAMIDAFNKDEDIHTATASEIFNVPLDKVTNEMRSTAKTVNFGVIYGISDFGLAKSLKIKKTEAASFIGRYFTKYPGVKAFIDSTVKKAKEEGYAITMLGRKRPLPDINSPNQGLRGFAERTAINTPVQGTAADMIKIAMVNVANKLQISNIKCQMILQVHDELVFELPENEVAQVKKIVADEMEKAIPLSVPIKVDIGIGKSWAETV